MVDYGKINIFVADLRVRTGLSCEGEFPVTGLVQCDEGEGSKYTVIHDHAVGTDTGSGKGAEQELAEGVGADLADHGSFSTKLGNSCQEIGGGTAGMGGHGGIALCIRALAGKIDEQLAQCNDIIHSKYLA